MFDVFAKELRGGRLYSGDICGYLLPLACSRANSPLLLPFLPSFPLTLPRPKPYLNFLGLMMCSEVPVSLFSLFFFSSFLNSVIFSGMSFRLFLCGVVRFSYS